MGFKILNTGHGHKIIPRIKGNEITPGELMCVWGGIFMTLMLGVLEILYYYGRGIKMERGKLRL